MAGHKQTSVGLTHFLASRSHLAVTLASMSNVPASLPLIILIAPDTQDKRGGGGGGGREKPGA